jgi:RNA polymerase sigma-70 factor, ECF subfamily
VYLTNETDDSALVRQCLTGDAAAFETLVKRYQQCLFNVAYRMLGSYDDALDSTQNAFIKAYEHLERFDTSQRFFSWLYRILKNDCLNALRDRRPSEPLPSEPLPLDLSGDAAPRDSLEARERQRAIQAALMKLSTDYREVVVLRHFTELSYEEIGATLGIPVRTVKSRLYTARQQLGGLLAEWRTRP